MPDYSKGKIYKLCSNYAELPYIGSTTQTLSWRFNNHQSNFRCWEKGTRRYCSSFKVMKYADVWIELIEDFPCKTDRELKTREANFIIIGKKMYSLALYLEELTLFHALL